DNPWRHARSAANQWTGSTSDGGRRGPDVRRRAGRHAGDAHRAYPRCVLMPVGLRPDVLGGCPTTGLIALTVDRVELPDFRLLTWGDVDPAARPDFRSGRCGRAGAVAASGRRGPAGRDRLAARRFLVGIG